MCPARAHLCDQLVHHLVQYARRHVPCHARQRRRLGRPPRAHLLLHLLPGGAGGDAQQGLVQQPADLWGGVGPGWRGRRRERGEKGRGREQCSLTDNEDNDVPFLQLDGASVLCTLLVLRHNGGSQSVSLPHLGQLPSSATARPQRLNTHGRQQLQLPAHHTTSHPQYRRTWPAAPAPAAAARWCLACARRPARLGAGRGTSRHVPTVGGWPGALAAAGGREHGARGRGAFGVSYCIGQLCSVGARGKVDMAGQG